MERVFKPRVVNFAERVKASFSRQGIMDTLGARLGEVLPGKVEIILPYKPGVSQQHGFFHAGATSTVMDSAGGYAAFSLFPENSSVLTVEFKVNLMAPAEGEVLRAVGQVIRSGRTLTICDVDAFVEKEGQFTHCARMQMTLMCLAGQSDRSAG